MPLSEIEDNHKRLRSVLAEHHVAIFTGVLTELKCNELVEIWRKDLMDLVDDCARMNALRSMRRAGWGIGHASTEKGSHPPNVGLNTSAVPQTCGLAGATGPTRCSARSNRPAPASCASAWTTSSRRSSTLSRRRRTYGE